MGWKRARHNALTTAETPVTNEQNARNYRWYETPVKCRVKCIHFVNRFFVLRGHGLNARSFHGQVPTTTSTPKVQKCMQHKHAVAGDSSTCSRDPHLILRRGVAIPHGNHVRLVCCSPRTRVECAHYNDNTYDEDDIDARSPQTHASLLGSTLSVSLGWQRLGVAAVEQ